MTIGEANAVNVLLRALTNEDDTSWEDKEKAGAMLADRASKVLMAGHDGDSFREALARGQNFSPVAGHTTFIRRGRKAAKR